MMCESQFSKELFVSMECKMIIDISGIIGVYHGTTAFDLTENLPSFEYMGDEIEYVGPVSIKGSIVNSDEFLRCTATISATLLLTCGRCLTRYEYPLCTELDAHFTTNEAEYNDNIDLFTYNGESIDLNEAVISSIVIAIPNLKLCTEDCKGLCLTCGANLNDGPCKCSDCSDIEEDEVIDQRLAALKKFFE